MDAVYEINGYLDNNIMWNGEFVLKDGGWFTGVAYIKDDNQTKEALIFGNFLPNKIIDFMITGPNTIIGAILIKTANDYEGVPVRGDYIVDEDRTDININRSKSMRVVIDEKLILETESAEKIKNKISNLLSNELYLMLHDSAFSHNYERQGAYELLYSQYKGNVKALTRDII